MELHSHIRAKKIWNYIRAIYFMMRKGLISKRKLLMNLNIAMKRRNKHLKNRSSFTNLFLFHHPHARRGKKDLGLGFGLREYEFSCSNSPSSAVFSHKRRHNYFPCLGMVIEEPMDMWQPCAVARIEYSPSPSPQISLFASGELEQGEKKSTSTSPLSIRIVDYAEEEEDESEEEKSTEDNLVDGEAEEFIRRFYEHLQAQNRIAFLEYHEREYRDMLARGT